ncbi:MAG: helix-turn-helix transcriptional regulator [Clostridia bacterium]|nr:helix-turn-helix transcriptional regulator [Clostridia bacterium]
MDVGARITELRIQRGLTVNKLANLSGISQSYLRDIELGNKNPTVEYLEYICLGLNVSLPEFF